MVGVLVVDVDVVGARRPEGGEEDECMTSKATLQAAENSFGKERGKTRSRAFRLLARLELQTQRLHHPQ